MFAQRPAYNQNCTVASAVLPNGSSAGSALRSEVAAFRIGDGEFVSIPGEAFPFSYLRGFLGPQDMPGRCTRACPRRVFRDRSRAVQIVLGGVVPALIGALAGILVGVCSVAYWAVAVVAGVGGFLSGFEHQDGWGAPIVGSSVAPSTARRC